MTSIRLTTSDGGFVEDVTIPPFQKLPEIIVWGERHFVGPHFEGATTCYREAFAFWVNPGQRRAT